MDLRINAEIETEIRKILTQWVAKLPQQPYKDFGKAITLESVSEKPTFIINLHTLYDVRGSPISCVETYSDELAAAFQPAPVESIDVWKEIVKNLKAEFITQEADVPISTSFEVVSCSLCEDGKTTCEKCSGTGSNEHAECSGRGRIPCRSCGGRGKLPCTHCRGRGKVPKSVSSAKQEEVMCTNCNGEGGWPCKDCEKGSLPCKGCNGRGRFKCANCKGEGNAPCKECKGNAKVLKGFKVHVMYAPNFARHVLHDPAAPKGFLPDEFPLKRLGERVYAKEGVTISLDSPLPVAALEAPIKELIQEADKGKEKFNTSAKIIKQDLFVEKIPVYSVAYKFENKSYSCWVSPFENRVSAKESPFKDLAQSLIKESSEKMRNKDFKEAKALLSKATNLAGGDPDVLEAARGLQSGETRDFEKWNLIGSLVIGLGFAGVLAIMHHRSHHLFGPLSMFSILSIVGSVAIARFICKRGEQWISGPTRVALLAVSSSAPAILLLILFALMAPIANADQREFNQLLTQRFGPTFPLTLQPEDQSYLKTLIGTYEPMGVDVSTAKGALEAEAIREEEVRRQQAEAERLKAVRQAQLRQQRAEAAKRKKAKEAAKKKAELAKKKKAEAQKKKKKKWHLF